jgi:predicted nucleotidyltransferase
MPTVYNIPPEKLAVYRATAQHRREQKDAALDHRRKQAWSAARQAAELLKTKFNANRVVLFGSLARESGFNRWSDVDVAAWGIAPEDTFRAIGAVQDMNAPVEVNLVDVNTCRVSVLKEIERHGIEL